MNIIRQSACRFINPITVDSYGFLFICRTVGQALDSMTALLYSFNQLVGACCLSLAEPTVAQLDIFFASHEPYSLFRHSVLL